MPDQVKKFLNREKSDKLPQNSTEVLVKNPTSHVYGYVRI